MPDFDSFLNTLKKEIVNLAETQFDELREQAIQDGTTFLRETRGDLKRWTRLMDEGKLTRSEVASLVRGQKDLAEMEALKQSGLAAAQADRFRNALMDRIIRTAVGAFL